MYNVNLAGKIQTVNGLIEPENLGITLTHEHLFCDQSGFSSVPTEANKKSIFSDYILPSLDQNRLLRLNILIFQDLLHLF